MLKLMSHQAKAVEIAKVHDRYALMWDCGLGKSIATLSIVSNKKKSGFFGKTVVLAPKSVMYAAWAGDAEYFPELKVVTVWASTPAKRKKIISDNPDADLFVTNYETFKSLSNEFYEAGVRRLVIDESSKVKNHESQISKACHRFSDQMESVYILSGTPAPNNRTEYWSQMRCVDSRIFGDSFYRFASRYFFPLRMRIQGKDRIVGWRPIASMEQEFFEKLQSKTWSLTKEECLDLPEQVDIVRPVTLSDCEFEAYVDMLAECKVTAANGETWNSSLASKVMKLRQITGGSILTPEGPKEIGRSKLDALSSIFEEIGDRPIVVWAEFTHEIDRIVELCKDCGRGVGTIDGRVSDPGVRQSLVADFQRNVINTLVCHPQAAGHGITLTAASYSAFYSHSFSFETYKQARDRIHRVGQANKCIYYHLVADGTVDDKVVKALQNKGDAHNEVMALLGGIEYDGERNSDEDQDRRSGVPDC